MSGQQAVHTPRRPCVHLCKGAFVVHQTAGQQLVNNRSGSGERLVKLWSTAAQQAVRHSSTLVNRQSTHLASLATVCERVEGEGYRKAEVGARMAHDIKVKHTALQADTAPAQHK
jgi:hypothetical protein